MRCFIEKNDWGKLGEIHRKIIAIVPNDVDICLALALHCLVFRQYEKLQHYSSEALKVDSHRADVCFYRGECYSLHHLYK